MRASMWFVYALVLLWPSLALAQETKAPKASSSAAAASAAGAIDEAKAELFVQKCASCHTVGEGVRVGPDLKDAHKRRDDAWLHLMIQFPSRKLDSDPDARAMVAEFKGVRM
ncbi:MAG TPA: c-type cytochrome, partial [Sorangium sp.]|nr:c-type cytochrome [Sorangium sp.]